jgi:hypothetical protein
MITTGELPMAPDSSADAMTATVAPQSAIPGPSGCQWRPRVIFNYAQHSTRVWLAIRCTDRTLRPYGNTRQLSRSSWHRLPWYHT